LVMVLRYLISVSDNIVTMDESADKAPVQTLAREGQALTNPSQSQYLEEKQIVLVLAFFNSKGHIYVNYVPRGE
jgi:hypothetical protein